MKKKIHIIGAGISGLVAALVLENHGYDPVIIESSDREGGRVKTDVFKGYQLDRGFQVLLTAYPAAKKYLNYKELDLQLFLPGSVIFKNRFKKFFGDPIRSFSLLIPTLFSGVGTWSDRLNILKLNRILKETSVRDIFSKAETSTMQYLLDFGFTKEIISDFFRPFFSGVFLETELSTSSRMFEFVFKMFGEGHAALPKAGIEAIPKQLSSKLKRTKFYFRTKVDTIENTRIILSNGVVLDTDFIIVAADVGKIIPGMNKQPKKWKSCDTLYFEADERLMHKAMIGLISNEDTLINNIFYHSSQSQIRTGEKELLSVTVVRKHNLSISDLVAEVIKELEEYCKIRKVTFLKHYGIENALPYLKSIKYSISPVSTKLNDTIFLAGDTLLNGSLNAAMISGEKAALGVVEEMQKNI
jgi:protoporphyrinogen oxidase